MREQLFHLPTEHGASLQTQVREMIVRAILDGNIPPGSAVPSCRHLARQLRVARNTVVLAYQRLVDEGYLVARERSGYYVNTDIMNGRVEASPIPDTGQMFAPAWEQRLKLTPSKQRNITKPKDWQRYQYPFIYGQIDLPLFPLTEWRECSREALSARAVQRWTLDSFDSDDPELIEQLRTRVLPRRGVWVSSEEILITLGAQQALYLLSQLLMTDTTVVGIEEPGYTDARNIFSARCNSLRALPIDEAGLIPGPAVDACDYIYTTPSHQFPTTVTMTMERREELLVRAVDADTVLIEDDYESEANYFGNPTPSLKSLDLNDRVIYVGSLSKTLAPGLRLGYMVGSRELIHEARALRRLMLRHPPANNERTVALFLTRGHHDSLVRRLSHAYQERWQTIGAALAEYLPESARMPAFGGTACWVRGPEGLDTRRLQQAAKDQSILLEAGDIFYHNPDPPQNYFRLGFSSISTERIEPGIEKIAQLIHSLT